jgi:WD40 repeat protein
MAIQFAWGLHHAHEHGLVHTDIKPANVMLTGDGTVKVTDFGLANVAQLAGKSGICTPEYASPEQLEGKTLSSASDVWSYACSVLEMFRGHYPEHGPDAANILQEFVDNWGFDGFRPAMPERLVEVLHTCFAPDPAARPNLIQVADSLQDIYKEMSGIAYRRPRPEGLGMRTDDLNNKAVSLLDLGHTFQALELLETAVAEDTQHLYANYNRGVLRWRHGRLSDLELVSRLRELATGRADAWDVRYLTAWVHIERGDDGEARSELSVAKRAARELEHALGLISRASAISKPGYQIIQTLRGHKERVLCTAMSPDGRVALSGSDDKLINVWEPRSGKLLRTMKGHFGAVRAVAVTEDGRYAASGGEDAVIRLWEVSSGKCLKTMQGHTGSINGVALSRDGKLVVSAGVDGTLRFWAGGTGQCLRLEPAHQGFIWGVAMTPNGLLAVSAGEDETVYVWDVETGQQLNAFTGHSGGIRSVGISNDGRIAISAGDDGTIRVWDLKADMCLHVMRGHQGEVTRVSISPDGRYAMSVGNETDKTIRFWHLDNGRCRRSITGEGVITDVAVSADGTMALEASADMVLRLWQLPSELPLAPPMVVRPRKSVDILTNQRAFVEALQTAYAELEKGRFTQSLDALRKVRDLPGYERSPECLHLWSYIARFAARRNIQSAWVVQTLEGHRGRVTGVEITDSGEHATTVGEDGMLRMWELATGQSLGVIKAHNDPLTDVALSGEGRIALTWADEKIITVWDLGSCERIRQLQGHEGRVISCAVSRDGGLAISCSPDESVRVWNPVSGRLVRKMQGLGSTVAISSDGRLGALALFGGDIWVFDIRLGQAIQTLRGHDGLVHGMRFTPDGRTLVSVSEDQSVRNWDLTQGRCTLKHMKAHERGINGVAIMADGRHGITASKDRTLKVWDLRHEREPISLVGHDGPVTDVATTADGRLAVSTCTDGVTRVWHLDWELDANPTDQWVAGASPCLEAFFCQRFAELYGPDDKAPGEGFVFADQTWSAEDLDDLMGDLSQWGYAGLTRDMVWNQLHTASAMWSGPAVLPRVRRGPPPTPGGT